MASINWKKLTMQSAGALYVHLDQNARQNHEHANKNINKELTCQNYIIGADSFADAIKSMKARTAAVDAVEPPQRLRKDRVVCCMLEYTTPPEIASKGLTDDFLKTMYEILCEYFGKENVHGSFCHFDEIHEYIDVTEKTARQSLIHAHTLVSCYVTGKGINGRAFETREKLNDLNKTVNYVLEKKYNIKYNNGKGRNYETIETLKAKSEKLKLEQELEQATTKLQTTYSELKQNKQELNALLPQLDTVKNILQAVDNTLYPDTVKRKTKGVLKKEDYVEVPDELWKQKWLSANAAAEIETSLNNLKRLLIQFGESASGQKQLQLEHKVSELEQILKQTQEQLRYYERAKSYNEGKTETLNKVNQVVAALPEQVQKQFAEEWKKQEQFREQVRLHKGR